VITRAGPRYKQAFFTTLLTWAVQNSDLDLDSVFIDILRRCLPPLTVEDISILTQDSQAAKTLPFSLISSDSGYHLVLGRLAPLDASPH
jgi:hypothetical protein